MNWAGTKIKNRIKLSLTEKNNYTNERSYLVRKLDSWSKQVRTGSLGRSEGGEYGDKIVKPFAEEIESTAVKNMVRQGFIFMEVSYSV